MTEEHREFNRGWFFPIAIVRLWDRERINGEQMMLLGIINALQDPKKGGCWASDIYLAHRWHKSRGHVWRTLQLFENLGVITIREKDDLRIIRVTFAGDGMSPKGDKKRLQKETEHKKDSSDLENGLIFDNGESDGFVAKQAARLEEFIRKSRKLHTSFSRQRWRKEFRKLLGDLDGDEDRLKWVLSMYLKHPHNKYTPRVTTATDFRHKFGKLEQWASEFEDPPKPDWRKNPTIIVEDRPATDEDVEALPE